MPLKIFFADKISLLTKKELSLHRQKRKDAGVADRDGLENRCTGNRTEGSNPSLSATKKGLPYLAILFS